MSSGRCASGRESAASAHSFGKRLTIIHNFENGQLEAVKEELSAQGDEQVPVSIQDFWSGQPKLSRHYTAVEYCLHKMHEIDYFMLLKLAAKHMELQGAEQDAECVALM